MSSWLTGNPALERTIVPNVALGWLFIVIGFAVGALMGTRFQDDSWMGGYASFKRRLYRLGHVAFFGLAIINILFSFTAASIGGPAVRWRVPSWGFLIGGMSMPICCIILAHRPRANAAVLFALPIGSLLIAGLATLWQVLTTL